MKFLFILLSFVLADNSCSESNINQNTLLIEYSARSRGIYKNIKINKKTISIINKREAAVFTKPCSKAHWDSLLKVLKPIDVKNISHLKAPSQNRFFDGAAIARLKIVYNGNTYETQAFDHGNPPEEIAALVKEILSISENIE
ncbi:hypothetical protein [Flavivirga algicola]|uniref:Lipoprotein n=1 Tax=Flavivirga algicola TaxID=2729136 RepID=A0ABX1RW75_9FLAO|nr:hypothetical protein [Flavivirga algicola]NMH86928.1 hypothetical protein [Flavivirga algicola]